MRNRNADHSLVSCAVLALVAAGVTFGFYMIRGQGTLTITNDFNVQQIPFAAAVWNALRSGRAGEWCWNLDLGASLITGFAFYNLGSPFFWVSLLFPRGAFPCVVGFLYMAKYVVAAVTACLYLRLFVQDRRWAVVGALLYAFSGFQATNLAYYHFHDVVALFPLLLLGLESAMKDRGRRPVFIFAVFINCLVNYFFFVGEVVFLILYFLVRYRGTPQKAWVENVLTCLACGALGVGMAAVLFLPSVLYIRGNSRSRTSLSRNDLVYDLRNYLYILKGFLFPGDDMLDESAVLTGKWKSTSCYLPFFGVSMVLAYLGKDRSWLRRLLLLLLVITLFPILQSVFVLFATVYQRWWYMLTLVMALATVLVLEKPEEYRVGRCLGIYAALVTAFYLGIRYIPWGEGTGVAVFHGDRFLLFYLLAVTGPVLLLLLKRLGRFGYRPVAALTVCCCILTTGLTLHYYRQGADEESFLRDYRAGLQLASPNDQYRYNSVDNTLMLTGQAIGVGAFTSTPENSSRDFDQLFDIVSSNSTERREEIPGLPQLLGGRYTVASGAGAENVVDQVVSDGLTYSVSEGAACPIGFAVDYYILREDLMALDRSQRAVTLMRAAVVDPAAAEQVAAAAEPLDARSVDYERPLDDLVGDTVEQAVGNFTRDSSGFACTTDYGSDRLVYFTVPWDRGWTAEIDGAQTAVVNSGGMMVLVVPAGAHQLRFTYRTPGFRAGLAISLASFAVFFGLCAVGRGRRKTRPAAV